MTQFILRSGDASLPVYLGTANLGKNVSVNDQIGLGGKAHPVYYTDDYIDFGKAKRELTQDANQRVGGNRVVITQEDVEDALKLNPNDSSHNRIVREGYTLVRDYDFRPITVIVDDGAVYELPSKLFNQPYGIEIKPSAASLEKMADTIFYSTAGNVSMPNSFEIEGIALNPQIESASCLNVVYYFPNAATISAESGLYGHIFAPAGNVRVGGGFYNGCIIADAISHGAGVAEGHMWPYRGGKRPNPTTEPEATPTTEPEATPTTEPEATPTATPAATPSAVPTQTPRPTEIPKPDLPKTGDSSSPLLYACLLAAACAGILIVARRGKTDN